MTSEHGPSPLTDAEASTRRRLEMALRSGRMGTYSWDPVTGAGVYDEPLLELYGFGPGEFGGRLGELSQRVHPEDRQALSAQVRMAVASGSGSFEREFRVVLPDGIVRYLHGYGQVFRESANDPATLVGVVVDVTAVRTAELAREAAQEAQDIAQQAARASQRRLELLARSAALLDSPLDLDATLQRIADLSIGELADWCTVDLETDDGSPRHVAVAHEDPAMVSMARELQKRYPPGRSDSARRGVLDSLQPLHVPEVTDEMLVAAARDEEHLALLRALGMASVIVAPLQAGGRAFGTLNLVTTNGRRLGAEDVDLALELGRRAGSAVDKVRLYAERDEVAQILQRSLLPPALPDVPGVELAAHYAPAEGGLDIGGDFYDVFQTSPTRWWVVLGDVCGKGPAAASLTGVIRYTTRAFALGEDTPGRVLGRVNETLLGQDWQGRFATLVLATFEPAGHGAPLTVHLSTAGHPPPLHKAGGTVRTCGGEGLPLGLLPDIEVTTVAVDLAAGNALVLYTDGATEARTGDGSLVGQDGLRRIVSGAPAGAGAVVDAVRDTLREVVPHQRDDLALVVLALPEPAVPVSSG